MTTEDVTIDDILATLDKDTLSMVAKGRDISTERLPTASFGLNNLVAGLKIGAQHTIWGNEQSGKSALMLQTVALNQANGVPCAWIDAEHSFDPAWATRLGVDVDKLVVSQVGNIADAANLHVKLIGGGMKLIVLDSTSALKPASNFKDGELKDFQDTRQVAQFARDYGNMCSYVQGRNWTCAVVHISQIRVDLGNSFMPGFKPAGGMESAHTDQLRIRLTSSKSEKQAIKANLQRGSVLVEEIVGRKVTWNVSKNKLNGKYKTGTYDLYVLGDTVGIDRPSELVAYGIEYGIIQKGGAWYTIYGERVQGDTKAQAYVRSHPEVAEKLEEDIRALAI